GWCGVKVEAVPWAEGKQTLTRAYIQFLAGWARRLSWKEVAEVFHTSWEKVFRSVEWIVEWGLANRNLSRITAIRRRRVALAKRTSIRDGGLPNRCACEAVVVGGPGSHTGDTLPILPGIRRGENQGAEIHL